MDILVMVIGAVIAVAGLIGGSTGVIVLGLAILILAVMYRIGSVTDTNGPATSAEAPTAGARVVIGSEPKPKSDHVIRLDNNNWPEGFSKTWLEDVKVAGISMPEHIEAASSFILHGDERAVSLQREPENKYDKNAVKVIGHWKVGGADRTATLGYLPAEVAAEIVEADPGFRFGAMPKALFAPKVGRSPGMRIRIVCKRGMERSKRYESKH